MTQKLYSWAFIHLREIKLTFPYKILYMNVSNKVICNTQYYIHTGNNIHVLQQLSD